MEDRTNHNALAAQFAARLAAECSATTTTIIPQAAAKASIEGVTSMSLFQVAEIKSAFLKMGIMGKQGAGKTKTAGKVAIGLVKMLKEMGITYASKPVGFYDTETGSDFLVPDFEAAGIPLVVAKSKTLADLIKAIDWAETNCSALIIDSITHPYREMIAAYLKTKKRTFLQIDDWQYLKGDHGWQMFTDRFINSKLHIIMCGRAGDDLEQYTDDQGKRQLEKIGTKMKGEAETGFEPSLLVLMELLERNSREQGARKRTFVNRATIVKDRWDQINGDQIDDPDFEAFLPHISRLALGGEHVGVRDTGDSSHILVTEKRDWQPVQRKIVLDETQSLLVMHVGGQAVADKQRRITLLKNHFGAGWVEIEETMALPDLRAGYDSLHRELEGKPSKYASAMDKDAPAVIADSLPDHSAPPATIQPSPELLASKIVVEAIANPPAEPQPGDVIAFDEPKWLAEITKAFEDAADFIAFGQHQANMMQAAEIVSAPTWEKATKIAKRAVTRLSKAVIDVPSQRVVHQVEAAAIDDGRTPVDTTTIAPNGMPQFLVRRSDPDQDASPELAALGG